VRKETDRRWNKGGLSMLGNTPKEHSPSEKMVVADETLVAGNVETRFA
jgi:hypothetical protein